MVIFFIAVSLTELPSCFLPLLVPLPRVEGGLLKLLCFKFISGLKGLFFIYNNRVKNVCFKNEPNSENWKFDLNTSYLKKRLIIVLGPLFQRSFVFPPGGFKIRMIVEMGAPKQQSSNHKLLYFKYVSYLKYKSL